jgi:hypothetical protein
MSEWTKTPTATGAYWFQIKGAKPDIVWIHEGRVWGALGMSTVERDVLYGMFYGPLFCPPPMPEKS